MDKLPSKLPLPRATKKVFQVANSSAPKPLQDRPIKVSLARSFVPTQPGQASKHESNEKHIRHKPSLLSKSWHSRTAYNYTSSTKSDKKLRPTSNGYSERQPNVSNTNSNISAAPNDSFRPQNYAPGPKNSRNTRLKNIGQTN